MKLFYFPNACSIGIHVLLHEVGVPFELERVNLMAKAQYEPDYVAINPKSKVPALLRDDGTVLTEFPAIAFYLAGTYPEAKLLPDGLEARIQALESLDYLIATVHMRGFSRVFRPDMFSANADDKEQIQQAGRELINKGFSLIATQLDGKSYLLGEFSIADAALFFLENWAGRAQVTLPPALESHLQRMRMRPSVQRTLAAEGLS